MVSLEVTLDVLRRMLAPEARGELGGDYHLVAILALLQPFADPCLGLLVLVLRQKVRIGPRLVHLRWTNIVRCVDEVAALFVKVIQHSECSLLVTLAHELSPRVSEVHGAET